MLLALGLLVALGQGPAVVTDRELDRLVAEYKAQGLPVPHRSAPLISTEGWVSNDRWCGYLLKEAKGGHDPVVMVGTVEQRVQASSLIVVEPLASNGARLIVWTIGDPFSQTSGYAIAAIERMRGHTEFARAILKKTLKRGEYPQASIDPESTLPVAPKNSSIEIAVRYLALTHWINLSVIPTTDRHEVCRRLDILLRQNPGMKNRYVKRLIIGLEGATYHRISGTDPVERLIDDLCDCSVPTLYGSSADDPDAAPLYKIVRYGQAAKPFLRAHIKDYRLTRAFRPAIMNSPPSIVTVGELCRELLEQF